MSKFRGQADTDPISVPFTRCSWHILGFVLSQTLTKNVPRLEQAPGRDLHHAVTRPPSQGSVVGREHVPLTLKPPRG